MAIYLLKVNIALMLLYGFYRIMVSRDTFFSLRRFTLWLIYAVALVVPFLNLEYWVRETPTMVGMANMYADTFYYPMVVVKAQAPSITWMDVVSLVYGVGVALLSLRFLWQLFAICHLAVTAQKREVGGLRVYVLKGKGSPFSFFRWIFVYPTTLEDAQLHEILVHECTHANGLHSLDSIFSELFTVVCWFNPFAWLMKQEVRINLEYLADESVLSDGNARKSYQYHLLGLAYREPVRTADIANNFNLLPLKKRIKMMNKRRTSEMGKAKYLLFAPLAGALLMVSNIESVAREIGEQIPAVASIQETAGEVLHSDVVAPLVSHEKKNTPMPVLDEPKVSVQPIAMVDSTEDKIYDVVKDMPRFPGEPGGLMKFLSANLKYPEAAKAAKQQGLVIVNFVINEDGSISNAKIAKSLSPELDAEALRVVNSMPKWVPGKNEGKAVKVNYTIPVRFSIPGVKDEAKERRLAKVKEEGMAFVNNAYPGGVNALMAYLNSNIHFPKAAQKAGKDKIRVMALAFIDKNGKVSVTKSQSAKLYAGGSIQIVGYKSMGDKSVSEEEAKKILEEEVDRVLAKMPKWKVKGQAATVAFDVDFVLM